ncbi:MAG: hypothetical protein M1130_06765 [Actinobacteria bacterium]|nr:hypothetical protein [Actinomycetota bacterium]
MGGCSGGSSDFNIGSCSNGENGTRVEELIKVFSIEEANSLIKEGHLFIAVYWNTVKSSEEYILGKVDKKKTSSRQVGFSIA